MEGNYKKTTVLVLCSDNFLICQSYLSLIVAKTTYSPTLLAKLFNLVKVLLAGLLAL